jgi:hypothetical protein
VNELEKLCVEYMKVNRALVLEKWTFVNEGHLVNKRTLRSLKSGFRKMMHIARGKFPKTTITTVVEGVTGCYNRIHCRYFIRNVQEDSVNMKETAHVWVQMKRLPMPFPMSY